MSDLDEDTKPLRIIHLSQPVDAGTARVVQDLARHGVEAGHRVIVGSPPGPLRDWSREVGAEWFAVPMSRGLSYRDVLGFVRIWRAVRTYDVVHLHSSKAGLLGRAALRGHRRRPVSVFVPHGWSWYVGGKGASLFKWIERVAADWTDVIVAVSRDEQRDGEKVLGGHGRIVVIPNGVHCDEFDPNGPIAARGDEPLLVQVGRLCEQKGQDRSIRMVRMLKRDVRLRFVGDGPGRFELEALGADLGISDRLEFVGNADPRPHLRAADVVLLPSRWEGMSLVLLEAMCLEKAVVATAAASSSVLEGAGVVVTDGEDVVARLAEAVTGLLDDPDMGAALGRAARAQALAQHDIAITTGAYEALWSDLRSQSRAVEQTS